jgi:hypothetical protein
LTTLQIAAEVESVKGANRVGTRYVSFFNLERKNSLRAAVREIRHV